MKRLEQLDSLRGAAAVIVIICHLTNLTVWVNPKMKMLQFAPFRFLWEGRGSVIVFFILSGFVLSLPFYKENNSVKYSAFIVKRICRIYIPYYFAILLGIAMRTLYSEGSLFGLWTGKLNFSVILNHLLLFPMFDQNSIDPVIWSLSHEIRISFIFPIIMYFILKYNERVILSFGIVLSTVGIVLAETFNLMGWDYYTNYFLSLHFILMFIVGALLAKNRLFIVERYNNLKKGYKISLFITMILLFSYSRLLIPGYAADWFLGISGLWLIISALSNNTFSKFLLTKPCAFLGKISYSIYLNHLIVILTVISLLHKKVSIPLLWIISILVTLIVSSITYRFIEKPSIKLGRYIVNKWLKNKKYIELKKRSWY